jgi:hypothetical protein
MEPLEIIEGRDWLGGSGILSCGALFLISRLPLFGMRIIVDPPQSRVGSRAAQL